MSGSNDLFGIAAHLHVLLRRKTGRVTDTEWMAVNADYAREIARVARRAAEVDGHAELLPWAEKLDAALQARTGLPTADAQAALLELELDGQVGRLPGGLFQRVAQG